MTVAPTACPHCHLTHATDWAVAVDRWRPDSPTGYRATGMPDAPLRATRAEAIADTIQPDQGCLIHGGKSS